MSISMPVIKLTRMLFAQGAMEQYCGSSHFSAARQVVSHKMMRSEQISYHGRNGKLKVASWISLSYTGNNEWSHACSALKDCRDF